MTKDLGSVTITEWVYFGCEFLSGLLSIVFNTTVLVVFCRAQSLQTPHNFFLVGLALADLLVGCVVPPAVLTVGLGIPGDFHGCLAVNNAVVITTNISILSLLALALRTFQMVRNTDCFQEMTEFGAFASIVVTWAAGFAIGAVSDLGWNKGPGSFNGTCSFRAVMSNSYMVYLVFFGVTLLTFLVIADVHVYSCQVNRKLCTRVTPRWKYSKKRQKKKVYGSVILIAAVVTFALCWFPVSLLNVVHEYAPEVTGKTPPGIELAATVLSHANSFLNPLLYTFSNRDFQMAFQRYVLCKITKRPGMSGSLSPSPSM